jgi:hypothetical protein
MLATMGEFMTIRKGCGVKGVDIDGLVRTFQAHGLSVKGYRMLLRQRSPKRRQRLRLRP